MRLIDADALKIDYGFTWDDITPTHEEMYALIDRQPSIDAVPVIRCKDCKSFRKDDTTTYCAPMGLEMQPDDYCSYAERKES